MGLLVWADRRFRLGYGRVFALYVMIYTAGRGWIESLRIDTIELDNVLGLRWGVWMSIILFVLAAAYFLWSLRARPGRESSPYVEGRGPAAEPAVSSEQSHDSRTRARTTMTTTRTTTSPPPTTCPRARPAPPPPHPRIPDWATRRRWRGSRR